MTSAVLTDFWEDGVVGRSNRPQAHRAFDRARAISVTEGFEESARRGDLLADGPDLAGPDNRARWAVTKKRWADFSAGLTDDEPAEVSEDQAPATVVLSH